MTINEKPILILLVFFYAICCASKVTGDVPQDHNNNPQPGLFEANSIAPNCYWYTNDGGNDVSSGTRGTYYEYREYLVYFSAEPCEADITWNGKPIGSTPFKYHFTGKLYTDENLMIKATPRDGKYSLRKARINLYRPMPRRIHFDFTRD